MFNKNKLYKIIFFAFLTVLLCAGCARSSEPDALAELPEEEQEAEQASPEPSEAEEALPLGLYVKEEGAKRVLQKEIETECETGRDIVVLSAFLTEEPEISGSRFSDVWLSYSDEVPAANDLKIGYRLSYELSSGDAVLQIIKASEDTQENREYIETYIYDDVHQTGWYSHLLPSDITRETVATSIKLTGGAGIGEVETISVEAFLYDPEAPSSEYGSCEVRILNI